MKLNSACIAVGGYGRHYLNAMIGESLAGRIRLAACADPFPPKDFDEEVSGLSERPVLYAAHKELLKNHSDLDLVTIGTGLHLHYPMLLDALQAGSLFNAGQKQRPVKPGMVGNPADQTLRFSEKTVISAVMIIIVNIYIIFIVENKNNHCNFIILKLRAIN